MNAFWSGFEKRAEEEKKRTFPQSMGRYAKNTISGFGAGGLRGGRTRMTPAALAVSGAQSFGMLGGAGGGIYGATKGLFGRKAKEIRKGESKD